MKPCLKFTILLVLLLNTACNNNLFLPAKTPTSTPSPIPTATDTPTSTSSPIPPTASEEENVVAPRWMILGQPGSSVEIFGETWNYSGDNWGEEFACINYTREGSDNMFFEQCFAVSQENQNFESVLEPFLTDGFERLEPKTRFEGIEQISLVGKPEAKNKKHFFEILQSKGYILLVEMNFVTEDNAPLQIIYEKSAADIIDYALRDSLQKSHLIASPIATPIPQAQQKFYDVAAPLLITLPQANSLYGGTWDILGDRTSTQRVRVCRDFEDRTNADVLWVGFMNCVFSAQDFPFEEIAQYYKNPGDATLESSHTYDGQFALYAYQDGHTYFDAYLLAGDYIFLVGLESRTLAGAKPEDVFSQDVDDFIYSMLTANIGK